MIDPLLQSWENTGCHAHSIEALRGYGRCVCLLRRLICPMWHLLCKEQWLVLKNSDVDTLHLSASMSW